ncbi:MAG: ribonuclease III [Bryobacteraceae bacterium]
MGASFEDLEAEIGYHFENREILRRALTHSSHANENLLAQEENPSWRDNEQLEFLGDSVLGFLTSEVLVSRFPSWPEGQLSRRKAQLVSAVHLYQVAKKLDLGRYLELGRGEEMSGGRAKRTLLVNALEALIAAMYLDGGIEPVRAFLHMCVLDSLDSEAARQDGDGLGLFDFKTALQELARVRQLPDPRYSVVGERGPQHSKTFMVEVRVGKDWEARAEGSSKKAAAQLAAQEVFERLKAE